MFALASEDDASTVVDDNDEMSLLDLAISVLFRRQWGRVGTNHGVGVGSSLATCLLLGQLQPNAKLHSPRPNASAQLRISIRAANSISDLVVLTMVAGSVVRH
jgi:hypothetical protein